MPRRSQVGTRFCWAALCLISTVTLASDDKDSERDDDKAKPTPVTVQQPYGYVAPVALSSPNLASGAASLFQPWFDAGTFAGDVRAYRVNAAGVLSGTSYWRALDTMNRLAASNPLFWDNARVIVTSNGEGNGVPFRFAQLSATQRALVGSEDVVNYVRGKRDVAVTSSQVCGEKDDDKEEGSSDDGSRNDDSGDKSSTDKSTKRSSTKSSYRGDGEIQRSGFIKVSTMEGSSDKKGDDGDDDSKDDDKKPKPPPSNCGPTTQLLDRPLIGAIIHSRPIYVGPPREGYPFDGYLADFAARMASRKAVVYVGANDGLLHAFDAATGSEIFGFVPSAVMGRLPLYAALPATNATAGTSDVAESAESTVRNSSTLADSIASAANEETAGFIRVSGSGSKSESDDGKDDDDKDHEEKPETPAPAPAQLVYTVDGFITTQDVRINNQWKTILVGGLGAGGQGLYALDVTNAGATATSEAAASALLLWEFDDRKDANLGYTYSRPSIIRLHDSADTWAVVVGNGYFSEQADGRPGNGEAALLILNAATGQLIKKLSVDSPVGNQANGLSSPTVIDENSDYRADYAYAGDLHGNVWKFDLRDANPEQWRVANGGTPLYTARDGSGKSRAITAAPAVGFHPINGFVVTVGTGRVLSNTDVSDEQTQAIYGLWDDPTRSQNITQLSSSTLTGQNTNTRTLPAVDIDWSTQQGWKIELPAGERILTEPIIRAGRVQFTSSQPKSGNNYFNQIDIATGSAPLRPFWDTNKDGALDDNDMIGGQVAVSLAQGIGLVSRPTYGMKNSARDVFYINRLVTAAKECVEKDRPKKKPEKEHNDDGSDDSRSDDGKSSRSSGNGNVRFASWTKTAMPSRSPFLKVSSGADGDGREGDEEGDDDEDDDHAPPPDECVEEPEQGDDDGDRDDKDRDGGKGGTCGPDFEEKPEPPPAPETTSVGTVNQGEQDGRNASGRQIWREVIRPEK